MSGFSETLPASAQPSSTDPVAHPRRTPILRLALIVCSLLVVAGLSSWRDSRLSLAPTLVELAASVLIWEIVATRAIAIARHRFGEGPFGSTPVPMLAAIGIASVPATMLVLAVFAVLGERVSSIVAIWTQSLLLGLLLASARRGLAARSGWPASPAASPVAAPAPDYGSERDGPTQDGPPSARAMAWPAPTTPPGFDPTEAGRVFLRRHAPRLQGRLLAIEAEDHYLRIHAEGGTTLVLMRLRDAVAELGAVAGWQPHRSWWVAGGIDAEACRRGGNWRLLLPSGLVIPVSRAWAWRVGRDVAPPPAPASPSGDAT